MSQNAEKSISKTMFAVEGNPNAILVINYGRERRSEPYWFPHPLTAFQWCLNNDAGFVYQRVPVADN